MSFWKSKIITGTGAISRFWIDNFTECTIINKETLLQLVMNRPADIPLITVSNHISTLDDPLMWGALFNHQLLHTLSLNKGMRWSLGAEELMFTNPISTWFFAHGQVIPIMRGRGIFQNGMTIALNVIKENRWLHVFPEGRVVQPGDPEVKYLKWGIGRLLMESPTKPIILPINLKGFDVMKPNDRLPRPHCELQISIGEPVLASRLLSTNPSLDKDIERSKLTARIYTLMLENAAKSNNK